MLTHWQAKRLTMQRLKFIVVSYDMNVNGAAAPISFRFPIEVTEDAPIDLDITQIRLQMLDTSAMDDTLFGSLAALTRGVIARHHRNDGINHMGTFRTNGAMALVGSVTYPDKVPAGTYSMRAEFRLAGQQNAGVVARIEPGNYVEVIIQDDLTGLDLFQSIVIGHVVEP
jgi:hypothetical protein